MNSEIKPSSNPSKRIMLTGIALAILAVAAILCFVASQRQSGGGAIKSFIQALARGDEEAAKSYLSSSAQLAVEEYCPNGSVIECFEQYDRKNWKEAREFGFLRGNSNDDGSDTIVYVVNWTGVDYSTKFELRIIREGGQFRIDTWRVDDEYPFPPGLFQLRGIK